MLQNVDKERFEMRWSVEALMRKKLKENLKITSTSISSVTKMMQRSRCFHGESKMSDTEIFMLKPISILILTLFSTGQMDCANLLRIHKARHGNRVA